MGQATTTFSGHDYLYAVFIEIGNRRVRHAVMAKSDYLAAIKVKKSTGHMPVTECDVVGPLPNGLCYGFPA